MGGSFGKKKASIMIIGLDNSGKTTMINHLKPEKEKVIEITPTVGYMTESFKQSKIKFTCFDMSG